MYQDNGFIFQLKKAELEGELPTGFINVTEKKGRVTFSTLDLVSLWLGIRTRSPFSSLLLITSSRRKEKAKCEDERCFG